MDYISLVAADKDKSMIGSAANLLHIPIQSFHLHRLRNILSIPVSQLPINSFSPTVQFPIRDGAHMKRPTVNLGHIIEPLDQGGHKRIIDIGIGSKCAMDVASHGINIPVDGEQGRMMRAAWNLFDEGRKGERFGDCEGFIMIFLANASLTVFIDPQEEKLVDIHSILCSLDSI